MDKVDVHEVFADARVAELADAIVDDDTKRVHALAKSVDLNAHGDKNVTLLEWAVWNRSKAAFEALLQEGANPLLPGTDGTTVVNLAAMANDPHYLDVLLARGIDPDATGKSEETPLRSAIMSRRDSQFRALLAAGADPNRADSMGDTALHVAGSINDAGRALELLKAGADPNARNAQDVTFQTYLFMTRESLLNDETRRDREAVRAWLKEHGIAVEQAKQ